ncbi:MIGE-like protein [Chrysochromulina ericina virus CeV-01B]|uniref:MIGE-like protein n=1 Tax=Chrysochromulina ericina virus CeV-01B TaxID=3070830 RepID=A0A0N9QJK8_9VIRU|nr:MIGE-like protein [Chrysochromulina ericina virus]ALH23410.1 MIGE-like protein [Chrysochromulina ericina virus CeV-01B]
MDDKWMTKTSHYEQKKYCCEKCDYYTNNNNDFNKHNLTSKHLQDDKWMTKKSQKSQNLFECR